MNRKQEKRVEEIDTKRLARQIVRRREVRYCCLIYGSLATLDTAQRITTRITSPAERITSEHLAAIQQAIVTVEV